MTLHVTGKCSQESSRSLDLLLIEVFNSSNRLHGAHYKISSSRPLEAPIENVCSLLHYVSFRSIPPESKLPSRSSHDRRRSSILEMRYRSKQAIREHHLDQTHGDWKGVPTGFNSESNQCNACGRRKVPLPSREWRRWADKVTCCRTGSQGLVLWYLLLLLQGKPDTKKYQETGKCVRCKGGLVIPRFCSIHFTLTLAAVADNIVIRGNSL